LREIASRLYAKYRPESPSCYRNGADRAFKNRMCSTRHNSELAHSHMQIPTGDTFPGRILRLSIPVAHPVVLRIPSFLITSSPYIFSLRTHSMLIPPLIIFSFNILVRVCIITILYRFLPFYLAFFLHVENVRTLTIASKCRFLNGISSAPKFSRNSSQSKGRKTLFSSPRVLRRKV